MKVGVDYYPEHWDSTIWEEDAQRMQGGGITLVRLAEFAWSRLEPKEGEFDFAWLDAAIDTLGRYGIQVVIGTPTATPPNWLVAKCPDILPLDSKRQPMYPGVRLHRCYNSPSLRRYTQIIVEKLTRHYGRNPHVIGWQTDNEMIGNDSHSDAANSDFRLWVQRKYGDLDTLNREWGTVVWSGEYSDWSQITTPLGGSPYLNPSYLLDYHRFCSDSVADFNRFQARLIRENCSGQFITHNLWGYPVVNDYYDLFDSMDFASVDYYPSTDLANDSKARVYHGALTLDLTRGIKQKNFWVMEQLSGTPGCWHPMSRMPYPGMIRAHAWQSVARGADTIVQFRWRTARIGAEQFWHGLHDHHGKPGRRFEEFVRFSEEVRRLSPLLDGTSVINDVAMLFSHEQLNALKIQPQADGFDYLANFKQLHRAFLRLGIGTDVINWTSDIDRYRLVVAPFLFLENEAVVEKLRNYVAQGGTVIFTTRSGVKNMNNVCLPTSLPGALTDVVGAVVDEYDPVGNDRQGLILHGKLDTTCSQWCDILSPTTAETIAVYSTDFFAQRAAITRNAYGRGTAYYIGSVLDDHGYRTLIGDIAADLDLAVFNNLPAGVELSVRSGNGKRLLFVLNLTNNANEVQLPVADARSALTGHSIAQPFVLEPMGVEVLLLE
ncbi:beta-galactosidase [Paraburkholderia caffeinilytica]|uniref:Beta-galactosidase n=2 Tax=Paraburkholderia caffeinilytica TaxID=1761016 RepID=A0ABQ1MNJ0_9BURK|nr:beta-galactosidase [Paraburkholderia caffeinilytica]AXL50492.1 beta-galactosidase [Paraburkholderia caffeinilytica]GGC43792.1 beta-galactosidase [Paraburkholderia caffeinilytica]CAB3790165.1 Beta-galactosidase BgaA [Paraburkholderia caffeinilytica]